MDVDGLLA